MIHRPKATFASAPGERSKTDQVRRRKSARRRRAKAVLDRPALPPGWKLESVQMSMVVQANGAVLWRGDQMPRNAPVTLNGRQYQVTASKVNNELHIEMRQTSGGAGISGQ